MPGLRRLRDPRGDAELPPGARRAAREPRVRVGDRLRGALPVLPERVRDALDPRARGADRERPRGVAAGSLRVGRERRRRRALDRRQPPAARAAAQREHPDPALQQPGVRADEGAVLADLARRPGDGADADGVDRLAAEPDLGRARRGGDVRRALDRHGSRASHRRCCARRASTRGRRSSRSSRTATSTTTARSTMCAMRRRTGSCSSTARRSASAPRESGASGWAPTVRRSWSKSRRSARTR